MPWWAILYFVIYGLLGVGGLLTGIYDRKPWSVDCSLCSNLIVVYLLAGFWNRPLLVSLGTASLGLFLAAMCWEIWQAIDDVRSDSDASFAKNLWAVLTVLIICLPAFVVAGVAAFRGP